MYTGKNNIFEKLPSESFGWKLKDNNMKYIRNILCVICTFIRHLLSIIRYFFANCILQYMKKNCKLCVFFIILHSFLGLTNLIH